jgi:hypothetical protein
MSMSHSQKEKVTLSQILLDAADHHSAVRIPDLLSDHTNRKGPLYSQTASEKIRTIIKFAHRCQDPILGVLWERA